MACILCGCTTYNHSRQFTASDGSKVSETTSLRGLMTKQALDHIKSRTMDNVGTNKYARTIGVDAVTNGPDAESINALNGLIGNAILQSLKKGAGVP